MKTIVATIPKGGPIKIETSGFEGSTCETATSPILKALGGVATDEKKPEYWQQPNEHAQAIGQK